MDKLSPVTLKVVRKRYERGDPVRTIAREEDVAARTIERYASEEGWTKGRDNRRIDDRLKRRCREMYCVLRLPISEIEKMSGVTRSTLYRWKKIDSWQQTESDETQVSHQLSGDNR